MHGDQADAFRFLVELAQAFNPVLIKIRADTKRPCGPWQPFIDAHGIRGESRLDLAYEWLAKGYGVALLIPDELWGLDCDDRLTVEMAESFQVETGLFAPRVRTPSVGGHLYFRKPAELQKPNLKAHICIPEDRDGEEVRWDFKLTGRTMLVAPGTIRDGKLYRPETKWFNPPIVDPRWLHPGLELFRDSQPYLVDMRGHDARTQAAIGYLGHAARAVAGHHGRNALRRVTANIVAFFQLDPGLAFHLLTHPRGQSWNDRCSPPWSRNDLWTACGNAVDETPPLGVQAWETEQARERWAIPMKLFKELMEDSRCAGTWLFASEARSRFLEWAGLSMCDCSAEAFGHAVNQAGWNRSRRTRSKLTTIEGISSEKLKARLQDQTGLAGFASKQNSCPLVEKESKTPVHLKAGAA